MAVVRVRDYPDFLSSVYNYIVEDFELEPRDFEMATNIAHDVDDVIENGDGLRYEPGVGVRRVHCYGGKRALHVHGEEEGARFCSEPEIAALLYVNRSVYGKGKSRLIGTLKLWLPTVTVDDVTVTFFGREVESDLYPSYSVHFLRRRQRFDRLTYTYRPASLGPATDDNMSSVNIVAGSGVGDDDDDDESEYCVTEGDRRIMVRRRRRSRSKSPRRGVNGRTKSPSGRRGGRRASRSRSRSRSRSPGPRKRSASRPRSRSRSRSAAKK